MSVVQSFKYVIPLQGSDATTYAPVSQPNLSLSICTPMYLHSRVAEDGVSLMHAKIRTPQNRLTLK